MLRAHRVLNQWQKLLPELREALGRRDVTRLKVLVNTLQNVSQTGKNPDLLVKAKQMLGQYAKQVASLDESLRSGDHKRIQHALTKWEFSKDNPLAIKGRLVLEKRSAQLHALTRCATDREMSALRVAVEEWTSEADNPVLARAKKLLALHSSWCEELRMHVAAGSEHVKALARALEDWPFSADDPILLWASGELQKIQQQAMVRFRLDGPPGEQSSQQ